MLWFREQKLIFLHYFYWGLFLLFLFSFFSDEIEINTDIEDNGNLAEVNFEKEQNSKDVSCKYYNHLKLDKTRKKERI